MLQEQSEIRDSFQSFTKEDVNQHKRKNENSYEKIEENSNQDLMDLIDYIDKQNAPTPRITLPITLNSNSSFY